MCFSYLQSLLPLFSFLPLSLFWFPLPYFWHSDCYLSYYTVFLLVFPSVFPCHSQHSLSFLVLLPLPVWLCLLFHFCHAAQQQCRDADTPSLTTAKTHTLNLHTNWAIGFHFNKGGNKVVFCHLSSEDIVNKGTVSKLTRRCYLPSTLPKSAQSWSTFTYTQPSSAPVSLHWSADAFLLLKHVNLSSSKNIFSDQERSKTLLPNLAGKSELIFRAYHTASISKCPHVTKHTHTHKNPSAPTPVFS